MQKRYHVRGVLVVVVVVLLYQGAVFVQGAGVCDTASCGDLACDSECGETPYTCPSDCSPAYGCCFSPNCGDLAVDGCEDADPPASFTNLMNDGMCHYEMAEMPQLFCNGACSWAGPADCDQADADIFCKLKTCDPTAKATYFDVITALPTYGFACSEIGGVSLGVLSNRGVSVDVRYSDGNILATHGAGDVIDGSTLECCYCGDGTCNCGETQTTCWEDCGPEDGCCAESLFTCGNSFVDICEDADPVVGGMTYLSSANCQYDFSTVAQMYCVAGCYPPPEYTGCGQAEADLYCKLVTCNPTAKAESFTVVTTFADTGFGCTGSYSPAGVQLGSFPNRGVFVDILFEDTDSLLAVYGPGDSIPLSTLDCCYCGDGVCNCGENSNFCIEDCPSLACTSSCGDAVCDSGYPCYEDETNCPTDCCVCGNSVCESLYPCLETPYNCPFDCSGTSPTPTASPTSVSSTSPSTSQTPSTSSSISLSSAPSLSSSKTAFPSTSSSASQTASQSLTPSTTRSESTSTTPSVTSTTSQSLTPSATPTPSQSLTPSATSSNTKSTTPSTTPTPSKSLTPSETPTASKSLTPTSTSTSSKSVSPTTSLSSSKSPIHFVGPTQANLSPAPTVQQHASTSSTLGAAPSASSTPSPSRLAPFEQQAVVELVSSTQADIKDTDGNLVSTVSSDSEEIIKNLVVELVVANPSLNPRDRDVASNIISLSLSPQYEQYTPQQQQQPQELSDKVTICLESNEEDGCLGYRETEADDWKCEDHCLTVQESDDGGDQQQGSSSSSAPTKGEMTGQTPRKKLLCGETTHFTQFSVLLVGVDTSGDQSGCGDQNSGDYITRVWWGDSLLALCVAIVVLAVLIGSALILMLASKKSPVVSKLVWGEEGSRIESLRRSRRASTRLGSFTSTSSSNSPNNTV